MIQLREIYNSVKNKISAVETLLEKELTGDLEIISEMSRHVIEGGGKRIRPALLCLCARALGYDGDRDVRYGAVFEMVHTATLIHDDIIDHADLRRGRKVLHQKYGTTISILFGDHLYNKAMELAIRDDDFRIVRLINRATDRMIGGEILQFFRNYKPQQFLEQYIDLIQRKTAWIFAGCAKAAAILAETGEEQEQALFEYGMNLGMAFQVIDDYFDYASSEKKLGKPVGSDLMEGKITYPLILLLQRRPEIRKLVANGFETRAFSDQQIQHIIGLMNEAGTLKETRQIAQDYARRAEEYISFLPDNKEKKALGRLPHFVVNRDK